MGYSGSRGLRSTTTSILPRHRRHSYVFLHRQSGQFREYPREVDTRGETLLSQCAHYSRRQQEGFAPRRKHPARAGQDEAGAGKTR